MDGMLTRMSSHLLTEWLAYHSLEPFGDELIDVHFAELKALVANSNRQKGAPAIAAKKFRVWQSIETFDAQAYFDQLKSSLTFKKWDE